jgi:hypothetical protein
MVWWNFFFPRDVRLFDGSTLEGWSGFADGMAVQPSQVFRVEREQLVSTANHGRIYHEQAFASFSFTFEYFLPVSGRTDVAHALLKLESGGPHQIGDSTIHVSDLACPLTATGRFGQTGDIIPYDAATRQPLAKPVFKGAPSAAPYVNKWNYVEIRFAHRTITVLLNGAEINRVETSGSLTCRPGFQQYGTDICIRNVRVRTGWGNEVPAAKSPDALEAETVWGGELKLNFTKTRPSLRPSTVTLTVRKRDDDVFEAHWLSYNDERMIRGTIKGEEIQWSKEDVECQKGNARYDTQGTLRGDRLSLTYAGVRTEEGTRWDYTAKVELRRFAGN